MEKFKNKYRIPSTRLQSWDYGANGAYFITICTQNREHFFGEISDEKMQLNDLGQLAENYWMEIPSHFPFIELGNFVVMPNHTHGILMIDNHTNNNLGDDGVGDDNVRDDNVRDDNVGDDNVGDDNVGDDNVETRLIASLPPPPTPPPPLPPPPPPSPPPLLSSLSLQTTTSPNNVFTLTTKSSFNAFCFC